MHRLMPGHSGLWLEFLLFYGLGPILAAVFMPPTLVFPMLMSLMILGFLLLGQTPGFTWQILRHGWGRIDWRIVVGFGAVTALVSALIMTRQDPDRIFGLMRQKPLFFLVLIPGYSLLSALPQETVFRVLFFQRYAAILPGGRMALVLNGAVFSLAHLMYWSLLVCLLTFFAGCGFAWAYQSKRSFALATACHALAGLTLFAFGMGHYFYSGNVSRPF